MAKLYICIVLIHFRIIYVNCSHFGPIQFNDLTAICSLPGYANRLNTLLEYHHLILDIGPVLCERNVQSSK